MKLSEARRIPLAIPNVSGHEEAYLRECIASTFVSSVGPFVERFARSIADVNGTERAVVLSSGTVALQMALVGLGIGRGDLVIMPSLTFIATANAISHSGAEPWICDSDDQSWALDLRLCRELIESQTDPVENGRLHRASGKILRALMPVMIMGSSFDFDAAAELAREFGLKIVVDAAAAIGARASGERLLGQAGADAVCFSFNGNKTITCGGGGAIVSSDSALIDHIKHLSSTARVGRDYDHDAIGYNFRMTNVQAALGQAQIERLDSFLERKKQIRDAYAQFSESFVHLHPFPDFPQSRNTHWFSGFWYSGTDSDLPTAFRDHMQDRGVDLRSFWKPIHLQAPYQQCLASEMPVSSDLWWRIFPLPCSTNLSEADLTQVLEAASDFWVANG